MNRAFRSALLTLATIMLLTACASQTPTVVRNEPSQSEEHTLQTMVTGIDRFDDGTVWGLNTGHGTFVVGPEVSSALKSQVFEHLMEAHDQVIIIRYRDTPASADMIAHKRVTAIIIQEKPYIFSR